MNAIQVGSQGMRDLLTSIFGSGSKEEEQPQPPVKPAPREVPVIVHETSKLPPLTPEAFDKMFTDKQVGIPQ